MSMPTDPLPAGWYWKMYNQASWVAVSSSGNKYDDVYAAWTFSPAQERISFRVDGAADKKPDVWIVRSLEKQNGHEYEASFPTRDEATAYISARAMLGTWTEEVPEE